MRNVIILIVVIAAIGTGIYSGKKSARKKVAAEFAGTGIKNGSWSYHAFGENMKAFEFLLATQCISGGATGQTLYFIANTDSEGKTLNTGSDYQIEGAELPCGSWSIAVYADDRLVRSDTNGGYLTKAMVNRTVGEKCQACISSAGKRDERCIQTGPGNNEMSIVLRIYNPSPELMEDVNNIELPVIAKI